MAPTTIKRSFLVFLGTVDVEVGLRPFVQAHGYLCLCYTRLPTRSLFSMLHEPSLLTRWFVAVVLRACLLIVMRVQIYKELDCVGADASMFTQGGLIDSPGPL